MIREVNKKELEKYFLEIIPELYAFSYAIIPEELQSEQIVIDTFMVLIVQEKNLLNSILLLDVDSYTYNERKSKLKEKLFKYTYQVAVKRYYHLIESFRNKSDYRGISGPFMELSPEERAVLFLFKQKIFLTETIAQIINMKYDDLIVKINLARNKLLQYVGHRNQELTTELLF